MLSNMRQNSNIISFTMHALTFLINFFFSFATAVQSNEISYVMEPFDSISDQWFTRRYNDEGKINLSVSSLPKKDREGQLQLYDELSRDSLLFGNGALRIEYEVKQTEDWGGFVDFGWILNSTQVHNCHGATHMSLWYKVLEAQSLPERVHLRLIMMDDSDCNSDVRNCADTPGQNLENYYSFHYVLDGAADGHDSPWKELKIDLRGDDTFEAPFTRTGWTGQVGNNNLDAERLRGWRIELTIDSQAGIGSVSEGVFLIDQLACVGSGDLLSAAFHPRKIEFDSSNEEAFLEQPLLGGIWFEDYHQSNKSRNFRQVPLSSDGTLSMNYTIEQAKIREGILDYQHLAPGNAYYNLSQSDYVAFNYDMSEAESLVGHTHLRFILMDKSDCTNECGIYPGQNLEHYYSSSYLLDNDSSDPWSGNITVALEGSAMSTTPFWRSGWTGVVGNNVLDSSKIKGYRFELELNSRGYTASFAHGIVKVKDFSTLSKNNTPSSDDKNNGNNVALYVDESGLEFNTIHGLSGFRRVEFVMGIDKCHKTCQEENDCIYAFSSGEDCYMTSYLHPESIGLLNNELDQDKLTAFWMDDISKRGDFCTLCDCHEPDHSIDCRGKDLKIVPKSFSQQWAPRVLDLRDNAHLCIIGEGALSAIPALQELRLPTSMRHISNQTLQDLNDLRIVSFEGTSSYDGNDEEIINTNLLNNVISSPSEFFGDKCCGLGAHLNLISPKYGLTFCHMEVDTPGIDSTIEPFVSFLDYKSGEGASALTPTSNFMAEAAESPEKCAEYCAVREDCYYFSYDNRIKQSQPTCYLLSNSETPSRNDKCCNEDDYADDEQKVAGWISGRPPRTRHNVDKARILIDNQALELDLSKKYKAQYSISLGSMPLRGAVWVESKVVSTTNILNITVSPTRVALYDDTTEATITVEVLNADILSSDESIVISNIVDSCDTAFVMSNYVTSNTNVYIDVKAKPKVEPKANSSHSPYILTIILVPSGVIVLCVLVYMYIDHKRRKADSVWNVKSSELEFGDPPEVIGRGTFGLVLLAEYRGTQVAVKRVIPPRVGKRHGQTMDKALFGEGEAFSSYGSSSNSLPFANLFPSTSTASESDSVEPDLEQCMDRPERFPKTPLNSSGEIDTSSFQGASHIQAKGKSYVSSVSTISGDVKKKKNSEISRSFDSGFLNRFTFKGTKTYSQLKTNFIYEMRHLTKLRHPCITTVMGAVISRKEEPMLIMEYMDHGSLYDLLHNETMPIEGEHILPILRDIAHGLRFLHAAKPQVIHGDLKAQNILVDSKFRAKVADFGLSQKKQIGGGTPFWMAPELLRGESQNTTASDVYSFGILLYEVYSRRDPYEEEDVMTVLQQVADPHLKKRPPYPPACPQEIQSFMSRCLEDDPNMRPTFEDIDLRLKHLEISNVEPGKLHKSMQAKREKELTDSLLFEVFPQHIAIALRDGTKVEPESRQIVTIFFSDIVGFTKISSSLPAIKISDMLDRLYSKFDALSVEYDVFKVETIGDAYMAATNLVKDQEDHTKRIAQFAIAALVAANETAIDIDNPEMGFVKIRVGFHSGSVVANVVGSRNPRYCLFGDTVNTASRMESNSEENRIHCSERAANLLKSQHPAISIRSRGKIEVKGKGEMETYWVNEGSAN